MQVLRILMADHIQSESYTQGHASPPKCPSTGEWLKKVWHIYTMEYYSARKRNEIVSFAET